MRFFDLDKLQSLLLGAILFIAPAVAGLSSCGVINDDLDPCPEGVRLRFVYDYNMEFANAFPSQVHCLTLLVYDENGRYVATRNVTDRSLLSDEDWRMTVDLPVGRYHLVAYGGMACDDSSFHYLEAPAEGSTLESLGVALDDDIMQRPVGTELHSLFFGELDVEVRKETMAYEEATLYMMKDTNNLRVLLQEVNGDPLSEHDFVFEVVDNNTVMNYRNDVVPAAEPFTYRPWTRGNASPGTLPDGDDATVAFAELSFGRLVVDNEPILHITRRSDGSDVAKIPLINYLGLLKSESNHKMSVQEYLDRESRWSLIFFLDKHWKWIYVCIEVNDWVVRVNNPELKY